MDTVGVDLGGTLIKLSWFSNSPHFHNDPHFHLQFDQKTTPSVKHTPSFTSQSSSPADANFLASHSEKKNSSDNNNNNDNDNNIRLRSQFTNDLKQLPLSSYYSFALSSPCIQFATKATQCAFPEGMPLIVNCALMPASQFSTLLRFFQNSKGLSGLFARLAFTGGGAVKFRSALEALKGQFRLHFVDEIRSFAHGTSLLLTLQGHTFHLESPFILVGIGSGSSVTLVPPSSDAQRVGGSLIGGGTFSGLARKIAPDVELSQLLEEAANSQNAPVDFLVGDIYGQQYAEYAQLGSDIVASSFGKFGAENSSHTVGDALNSLIYMISATLAQLAFLYHSLQSSKIHPLPSPFVVFAGGFLSGNPVAHKALSSTLTWWSADKLRAVFSNDRGSGVFSGSIGCLLSQPDQLEVDK